MRFLLETLLLRRNLIGTGHKAGELIHAGPARCHGSNDAGSGVFCSNGCVGDGGSNGIDDTARNRGIVALPAGWRNYKDTKAQNKDDPVANPHLVSITQTPFQSAGGGFFLRCSHRCRYMMERKSEGFRLSASSNAEMASSQRRSR